MAKKDKRIIVRATQDDFERLGRLAAAVNVTESDALRAIVRTATIQQVEKGVKQGQRKEA